MLTHLVAAAAARSRLVLLLTVAVLAGVAGGTWGVSAASGPRVTVATVADDDGATRGDDRRGPATATGTPRPRGAHGACVAAVARGAATGGKNDNHGGAVSRAAHTCAKPAAATAKGEPAKPKPAQTP